MDYKEKMAERQGFEPWVRKRTTVFETAPFDHSGTSPRVEKPGLFGIWSQPNVGLAT
jgi:hypothetical protein